MGFFTIESHQKGAKPKSAFVSASVNKKASPPKQGHGNLDVNFKQDEDSSFEPF
jgi:hypothetical protein